MIQEGINERLVPKKSPDELEQTAQKSVLNCSVNQKVDCYAKLSQSFLQLRLLS